MNDRSSAEVRGKKRIHRFAWLLALLPLIAAMGIFSVAQAQIQSVPNVSGLEDLVDVAWTNSDWAKIMVPGIRYKTHMGVLGYEDGFETNFLNELVPVTNGGIVVLPLLVNETNTSPRERLYINTAGTDFHTNQVPGGYDAIAWIEQTYGEPPSWLSGGSLSNWYAERDPSRQDMWIDLISTSDVPAYLAMLTNSVPVWYGEETNMSLLELYSNDIAFVAIRKPPGDAVDALLHAPGDVNRLDIYHSTNLCDDLGWDLAVTLEHTYDPLYWAYGTAENPGFFRAANPEIDTDGDHLGDAREMFLFKTNPYLADSDGDGLSDWDELNLYGTNPLAQDSDGDGILDGDEVEAGLNPGCSDTDGDGLTDYEEIYTYFTDPFDPDYDGDGLNDYQEIMIYGTYPRKADSDWDLGSNPFSDGAEVAAGSNPLRVDTDEDGIDDKYELDHGWSPTNAANAGEDDDEDGFSNLIEYQWGTGPNDYDPQLPWHQKLLVIPPGTNGIQQSGGSTMAVGDCGAVRARIRVPPFRVGTNAVPQHLHHTQAPGFYIDGTAAASVSTPIVIPAASTAVEYRITADTGGWGTNLFFELKTTNGTGICNARFYSPKLTQAQVCGPGLRYVTVPCGTTSNLYLPMPADTNACRIRVKVWQNPTTGMPGLDQTDWSLVKVTGVGADPTNSTVNIWDWRSAWGVYYDYDDAVTRGVKLTQPGSYVVEIGFDWNGNGTLETNEVQETCNVHVVKADLDGDTDRNGTIDDADESGEESNTVSRGTLITPPLRELSTNGNDIAGLATIRLDVYPRQPVPGMVVKLKKTYEPNDCKIYLITTNGIRQGDATSYAFPDWPTQTLTFAVSPQYARPLEATIWPSDWPIKFDLKLEIATTGGTVVASDNLRLKVAPMILPPECNEPQNIYSAVLGNEGITYVECDDPEGGWAQDMVKFVKYQTTTGQVGEMFVDLDHPKKGNFCDNLRQEQGWNGGLVWEDSMGGNGGSIMATPPFGTNPFGAIMIGSQGSVFTNVWRGQSVQPVIQIKTDWLLVGHTDEVLMWVATNKVLYADPWKAADLLHTEIAAGHGTNSLWFGKYAEGTNYTIEAVVIDNDGGGYKLTILPSGLPDSTNSTTIGFSNAVFAVGDILRVDNELLKVTATNGANVTVDRAQAGRPPAAHTNGSVVYAYSAVMVENIANGVNGVVAKIATATNQLATALGSYASQIQFVPMPVLFWYTSVTYQGVTTWGYTAGTANVVNCLVGASGNITYSHTGNAAFMDYVSQVLPEGEPMDIWVELHCHMGEIHCATAAQRELNLTSAWWQCVTNWE